MDQKKDEKKTGRRLLTGMAICLAAILGLSLFFLIRIAAEDMKPIRPEKTAQISSSIPAAAGSWMKEKLTEYKAGSQTEAKDRKSSEEDEEGTLRKPDDTQTGRTQAAAAGPIAWNDEWEFAEYAQIHTGSAVLYTASVGRRDITVAVNAGHGTSGGGSVKVLCHPDGSPKVTGGSTPKGSVEAKAVSSGTKMLDGTSEADAVLELAQILKDDLLKAGYDVLMIRDGKDVQLDNVARTVMANNNAHCHISLHYDSTTSNKGFFYTSVPNVASYRRMEPVASLWEAHTALGENILMGEQLTGVPIYKSGSMAVDLVQTSYSTIPSVDLEVGDRAADRSKAALSAIAEGIVIGLGNYFK